MIEGLDPSLAPGTLMLLEKIQGTPDPSREVRKTGWCRPIYALRRGAEIFCGHLEREGNQYALFSNAQGRASPVQFRQDEFPQLNRVFGVAVPI